MRPGKRVGGRYELVEPIGTGGFGRVWKARDLRLRADVAIKELLLPPSTSPTEQDLRLKRSEREALNAARLRDHPNIVSVHDVVVEDDVPWIVMQLVGGRALGKRLQESGPLPVSEATGVARAVLRALDAAHGAGIVHRDIKPSNVMLADNGQILLTDFGIATHEADESLTATGSFIGSALHMAPERVHGEKGQAPSDLFSLGVTLYETVEGVSPFERDSAPASLHAVAYEEPPPPQRAGPLTPLITRLLAKAPDARPTVAEALAMVDSAPPQATKSSPAPSPPRAIPTATGLTPRPTPQTPQTPPEALPAPPPAAQRGLAGNPAPASSRGSVLMTWLGWIVALALSVLVVVLVTIIQREGSETASPAGGSFGTSTRVPIDDLALAESTIKVAGIEGNAPESLRVDVDISHSDVTDLEIKLIAPDDTAFDVQAYDEPRQFTLDASAAKASGTWTLRIRDTVEADEGTLNSWALHF